MNRDWRRIFPSRRNIFLGGGGIVMGALTLRLAELQILRGEEYETKATANRIRLDPAPAHRGIIYDRTGKLLASRKRNFYVTIRPEMVGTKADMEATVDRLATILPISDARKRSILQDAASQARFQDILVADDLTWEDFARVNVLAPELSGVTAEVGELRSYPLQGAFFHTVGYVAKANEKDVLRMVETELAAAHETPDSPAGKQRMAVIRRLYKHPQMRVGKQGIENYAETPLKGEPGKTRVLVNAAGRVIERLPSEDIAGKTGEDIVLSVDADLQNFAIQRFGAESGSAVVIDVANGHVMAMMSTPSPDPNEFVSGISSTSYNALRDNIRNPLYHKAYDGVYPPGSTFKTIVAAAALESGAIDENFRVHCSGRAWYYNRFYHCWKPEGHGSVNVHSALQKSCDCFFYAAAERTGIEKIAEVAKKFGLGHRYEIGLTGGKSGSVPNDEWKRKVIKDKWYAGDTISAAIGQGYVTATPFQLAVMTARIAGGHDTPNPKLILSGMDVPDQEITPLGDVAQTTLEQVRAGMFAVTSEPGGTATAFGALDPEGKLPAPYTNARMAGKSGTAQVRVINMSDRNARGKVMNNDDVAWNLRDHALFVAYAPADKPRYACAIVVEHGEHGSSVGAPFAKDILAFALKNDTGAKPAFKPQKEVAEAAPKPGQAT